MSRYAAAPVPPRSNATSATRVCNDAASSVECTATVRRPSSARGAGDPDGDLTPVGDQQRLQRHVHPFSRMARPTGADHMSGRTSRAESGSAPTSNLTVTAVSAQLAGRGLPRARRRSRRCNVSSGTARCGRRRRAIALITGMVVLTAASVATTTMSLQWPARSSPMRRRGLYPIFDRLLDSDPETLEPLPFLATSWDFPDPQTLDDDACAKASRSATGHRSTRRPSSTTSSGPRTWRTPRSRPTSPPSTRSRPTGRVRGRRCTSTSPTARCSACSPTAPG